MLRPCVDNVRSLRPRRHSLRTWSKYVSFAEESFAVKRLAVKDGRSCGIGNILQVRYVIATLGHASEEGGKSESSVQVCVLVSDEVSAANAVGTSIFCESDDDEIGAGNGDGLGEVEELVHW